MGCGCSSEARVMARRKQADEEISQIQQMLISGKVTQEEFDRARVSILERLCPEFIVPVPATSRPKQKYVMPPEAVKAPAQPDKAGGGPIGALLAVHPPGKDVKVNICRGGRIVRRGVASQPISLDGLPDGEFQVVAYISAAAVDDEASDDEALDSDRFQVLGKFKVVKSGDKVTPSFLDTCATEQQITVEYADQPFSGADLVVTDPRNLGARIQRKTGARGSAFVTLPPGEYNAHATKGSQQAETSVHVRARKPLNGPPSEPVEPQETHVLRNCTGNIFRMRLRPGQRIAVMGDVSGSMNRANQMDVLKNSLREIYNRAAKVGCVCELFKWNAHVEQCSLSPPFAWIDRLQPFGGNNMRYAIEEVLSLLPNATDVVIMCDGDTTPFAMNAGNTNFQTRMKRPSRAEDEAPRDSQNWPKFAEKHGNVRFHFVALGKASQSARMQQMALEGMGGTFCSAC
eukprot:TRINITY_DN36028_c0_g1_i1.p1 TRINITY_DN36028_c0_g1~~TRINITY_DN36028_c0_g1_i1.p1  ORF type:complete len:475 (+),score=107.62 TRINITY_DN36028_c0_g1_i1:50-1426(+)